MSNSPRLMLAVVSLALAAASPVPDDNPKSTFLVINNTSQALRCSWKPSISLPGTASSDSSMISARARAALLVKRPWSAWFDIPAAANWRIPGGGSILMQCAAPVKRTIYTVDPGARYSFLRAADGSVDLVRLSYGR